MRATSYKNDSSPEITQYYYDNVGNVLRVYTGLSKPLTIRGLDDVVPTGDSDYHVTKYTYNFMGYPVKMTDSLGQEETYVTDYLGNILSKTDRNGDTVTTTYNHRGQPLSVNSSKDNSTITYTYDRLGNRTSMTDATGTTTYTYTNLSQLLTETKGGIVKTYFYDKNGNCTGFTLSDGGTNRLTNTYTVGSTGVMTAAQSGTDSVAYTYDNNRNLLTETINGMLSQVNTFNKANQAVSVQNKNGSAQQSLFTYTYSENGNMTAVQETLDSVSSRAFTYDGMGRLTAETRDGSTVSYSYDDFSNRTAKNDVNYLYDANNRLRTKTAENTERLYNYDNNGNIYSTFVSQTGGAGEEDISLSESISNQDAMYTFDGLNRLTEVMLAENMISYAYDGDGKRVSKTVDGITTEYVWDGDFIVMEKTGDSVTVYKRALRLFANEKDGIKTFYRYNARGDVAQITNADGTVTKNYKYDAFGNELNPDANDTNPFRYCGEYQDLCGGLIYLRNRYYDPSIGRFISEDPIRHGTNWYIYANNNPVMFIDPTGLIPSLEDAAEMASRSYNTYDMSRSGLESRKLGDGWRLIDEWKGSEGLVIHIYVRGDGEHSSYTGAKEYAFVNKGSSTWGDWANNLQQPFGWSTDMSESISKAEYFANGDWGNYEITFIGHSKGGAEAAANAVATNRNAILFNPAATALNEYGLNANTYSADMTVYVVKGEPLNALNSLLGAKAIDNYETLPFYSWNPIKNHSMEAIKSGVKGR